LCWLVLASVLSCCIFVYLQSMVPSSVGALMAVARRPAGHAALWALHALTLCAQSAGLAYMTHVQVSTDKAVCCGSEFKLVALLTSYVAHRLQGTLRLCQELLVSHR
jgi:hypothetical protein